MKLSDGNIGGKLEKEKNCRRTVAGNQPHSETAADKFLLMIAAARLPTVVFFFFFSCFCPQNLIIHVFWETSARPSKGCGKGQQPQGRPGSSLLLTASLSDVSTVFIHYSSVEERCKHSTQASWTWTPPPPRQPRRLDTWPKSASALFVTGQRTCRENTLGLLSLCFLIASWYSEGILCGFSGRKLCYQIGECKKKKKLLQRQTVGMH